MITLMATQQKADFAERAAGLISAVRPSDTLLAVGSVVSGLGSESASLDLLLIGPGAVADGIAASVASMRSGSYRMASGEIVTVRFCPHQEINAVAATIGRFDQAFLEPSVWANLPELSYQSRVLLHELRNGVVLANESIAQAWRQLLRVDQFHLYLVAAHLRKFASRRSGALRHLKDGDEETAQWALRECMEGLLAALLASVGETNPRKRWHLRLLRQHPEAVGTAEFEQVLRMFCEWHHAHVPEAIAAAVDTADALLSQIVLRCPALGMLASASMSDSTFFLAE